MTPQTTVKNKIELNYMRQQQEAQKQQQAKQQTAIAAGNPASNSIGTSNGPSGTGNSILEKYSRQLTQENQMNQNQLSNPRQQQMMTMGGVGPTGMIGLVGGRPMEQLGVPFCQEEEKQIVAFYQNAPMLSGVLKKGEQGSLQTDIEARRAHARVLLEKICRIRKPPEFDNMTAMMDSKRIFQTLLNTENIENKTNQKVQFNTEVIPEADKG